MTPFQEGAGITGNNVAGIFLWFVPFSSIISLFVIITIIIYMPQKCICPEKYLFFPSPLTQTHIQNDILCLSCPEVTVIFPVLAISIRLSNICNSFSTFSKSHTIFGQSSSLVNIYLLADSLLVFREQWNLTIFFIKHEVRKK